MIYILSDEMHRSLVADDDWDHFRASVKSLYGMTCDQMPAHAEEMRSLSERVVEIIDDDNIRYFITCAILNHDASILAPDQLIEKFKEAFCTTTGIDPSRATVKVEINYS